MLQVDAAHRPMRTSAWGVLHHANVSKGPTEGLAEVTAAVPVASEHKDLHPVVEVRPGE